jgi:hypothetical protein
MYYTLYKIVFINPTCMNNTRNFYKPFKQDLCLILPKLGPSSGVLVVLCTLEE